MEPESGLPQLELFDGDTRFDTCLDARFDILGDAFCVRNDADDRRPHGITLTPQWLVDAMLDEVARGGYQTIVDGGAGTGRFAIAAALRFPGARVVAVEQHAELAELLRQRVWECGVADRVEIVRGDFRDAVIPSSGKTLFIGNPPYVRHHDIPAEWKAWYGHGMASLGLGASQLAGLHAHFMLRAASAMRPGDGMCFVTSAEWLDNGYGKALRDLLGGSSNNALSVAGLWVADTSQPIFADALVSSVVVRVECGDAAGPVRAGVIADRKLQTLREITPAQLQSSARWSTWCRPKLAVAGSGVEVGDIFRVTRGQVTGLNAAWVLDRDTPELPDSLSVPSVTRAKEIIDGLPTTRAGTDRLKRVADLPRDLDQVPAEHREVVSRFLTRAKSMGADQTYIARHRSPWHAVAMRAPPAAFVSYMGRRPPVFCANPWQASFINIAHGLYPRQPMSASTLGRVLHHLNTTTDLHGGRMYGGGLAKFEPGDVARLRLPAHVLEGGA